MLTGDLPVSQHHRALAEAFGVVYHWDLVTDELTIPVASVYKREQTNNGVARTVPVSLPRLAFLRSDGEQVVTVDPTVVVEPDVVVKKLRPPTALRCPSGRPPEFYRHKPIEPIESRVYELWLAGHGRGSIAKQMKIGETTVKVRLFRARAKMGDFDDFTRPKG